MKNILLLTDFSDNGNNSVRYGLRLFSGQSCSFTILHSFYIPYSILNVSASLSGISEEKAEKLFRKLVSDLKEEFPGEDISTQFVVGDLEITVRRITDEGKVGLVVMGTGAKSALIGSSTSIIVGNANCPVLIVPSASRFKPPKIVLLAVDLRNKALNRSTLKSLMDICRIFDSKVLVLYITGGDEDRPETDHWLNNYLKDITHSLHMVDDKDVASGIISFAEEHNVDLIGMTHIQKNLLQEIFHRSQTRKMSVHTKIPLLVMEHENPGD